LKDHPIFGRRGSDIYVRKEIPFTQAILGGRVYNIPGLDGEQSLEIPEGTENGSQFKLPGKRYADIG
jgi:molecular chaperone DnaJ